MKAALLPALFCISFFAPPARAQQVAPRFAWVQQIGSRSAHNVCTGVILDKKGNLYTTGYFYDSVRLGGVKLVSAGNADAFVAKLDTLGRVLWARRAGGPVRDQGTGIGVDAAGNCYVTGCFGGAATFGGLARQARGRTDFFLARYDSAGGEAWVQQGGAPSSLYHTGSGLAADAAGNCLVVGQFADSATFGPLHVQAVSPVELHDHINGFAALYDAQGHIQWLRQISNTSTPLSAGFDAAGNGYISGHFQGRIYLGAQTLLANDFLPNAFVARLGRGGEPRWLAKVGVGYNVVRANGLAVEPGGRCFLAGTYADSNDFRHWRMTKPTGMSDGYVAGFDTGGALRWVRGLNGPRDDAPTALALSPAGSLYVVGRFQGQVSIGADVLTSAAEASLFAARIDPDGGWLWARGLPESGSSEATTVACDPGGNAYLAGSFSAQARFDTIALQSLGIGDAFIARLGQARIIPAVVVQPPNPDTTTTNPGNPDRPTNPTLPGSDRPVPSLVTANDDTHNDRWEPVQSVPFGVQIYNHWGSRVFATDDYANDWPTAATPPGVYYYALLRKDGRQLRGFVEVAR